MIIGATKKAQPLFSALPSIEDKEYGKQFAQINPLFSWHANYINVNRKKVIILLNDLTYTPIILQDINAQKKKKLPEIIPEAIRIAFKIAGISTKKIDEYLKLAGDIQVTTTSNRSVMGSINLMADEIRDFRTIITNETINNELMISYSDYLHTKLFKQGYRSSVEALREAFNKPLKVEAMVRKGPYAIEKTWDYSELSRLNTSNLSEQQREKYIEASIKNNEKLLAAFKEYTIAVKGLSEKTVKRHIEQLDFYLNVYLAEYEQVTPINSGDSAGEFLGDFFVRKDLSSSATSLKKNGSALKKLYQFLCEAGEISKTDLADINEFIRTGLQEGEEYLSFTSDDKWWF
ncbi:site-specific integrase [Carnobacterium sp. ISL-102]|uniref:DUF6933 domain-containing protein n=1 Tax=Carnobacterium sp. ISL-102 TaxID=2819142 RepID=UPI001BE62AF0|nr:site-specific integrase [Carnobacterium sp. ISL-102]MBT2732896.1 site-specific integrase [Carnobacterium sp. ISL-102]